MTASPEQDEYRYLVALLQRARVSLMGLMDAGTWSEPRGFQIDADAALSEAHATIREIEEATDIGDQRMKIDRLEAGMHLSGQVDTFVATFHVKEQHPEPLSECDNGTCRSSLKHLLAWELAVGDEGHNWIAEQGRKG